MCLTWPELMPTSRCICGSVYTKVRPFIINKRKSKASLSGSHIQKPDTDFKPKRIRNPFEEYWFGFQPSTIRNLTEDNPKSVAPNKIRNPSDENAVSSSHTCHAINVTWPFRDAYHSVKWFRIEAPCSFFFLSPLRLLRQRYKCNQIKSEMLVEMMFPLPPFC